MQAGNKTYQKPSDLPEVIPVFPLAGALLLPGGNLPLNIFEPRYLAMIDDALSSNRLIGMIQPDLAGRECENGPALCQLGCIGRLTGFQETGDGRYMINLTGVCRFQMVTEVDPKHGYRQVKAHVDPAEFIESGTPDAGQDIDRKLLLTTFRRYLEANNLSTDWDAVEQTDNETLVTALCMMSPYGPAEKQALLEADDIKTRADTLVAITEIELAKNADDPDNLLQ